MKQHLLQYRNCVTIIIVLHKQQTHQGQVFFAHGPDIQNKSNQEQWEIFHPMAEKKLIET